MGVINILGQTKGVVEKIPEHLRSSLYEYQSIVNMGRDKWGIPDKILFKFPLPEGMKVKVLIVEDK